MRIEATNGRDVVSYGTRQPSVQPSVLRSSPCTVPPPSPACAREKTNAGRVNSWFLYVLITTPMLFVVPSSPTPNIGSFGTKENDGTAAPDSLSSLSGMVDCCVVRGAPVNSKTIKAIIDEQSRHLDRHASLHLTMHSLLWQFY